jgi:hypothetical protein
MDFKKLERFIARFNKHVEAKKDKVIKGNPV